METAEKLYSQARTRLLIWCACLMLLMMVGVAVSIYQGNQSRSDKLGGERDSSLTSETAPGFGFFERVIITEIILVLGGVAISIYYIRQTLQPIKRAYKIQALFAANANHQLRTPIAAMQTELEVALLKTFAPDYQKTLRQLLQDLADLQAVSGQLLEIAPTQEIMPHPTSKDINEILAQLSRRYGLVILHQITPGIVTGLPIAAYRLLLEILIDNSIAHSGQQKGVLEIFVKSVVRGPHMLLVYRDNGRGLSAQECQLVLHRGYRGALAAQNAMPGNGIGLALLHDTVRQYGGEVRFNVPRHNTGFYIEISIPLYA